MLPMSSRWLTLLLVLLLAPALIMADETRAVAGSRADGAPVVFEATDYGFTGPDRIPSGVTTLQVVNKGQDLHHIQLLRLVQGKSAADFRAALKAAPGRCRNGSHS